MASTVPLASTLSSRSARRTSVVITCGVGGGLNHFFLTNQAAPAITSSRAQNFQLVHQRFDFNAFMRRSVKHPCYRPVASG